MRRYLFLGLVPLVLWSTLPQTDTIREQLNQAAYASNHFARKFGRDLELITRPGANLPFLALTLPMTLSLTAAGFAWHALFTTINIALPGGHVKFIEGNTSKTLPSTLKFMSYNACLREGIIAPYTGGIVPPFEAVEGFPSRVDAIAHYVGKESPDIFFGQEFNDLKSIETFIDILKTYGFTDFAYDNILYPLNIQSGLLIASKSKLASPVFIAFPFEDRLGIAKLARRGVLSCSLLNEQNQPILRLYNTHLDAGTDQNTRNRQLTKHILPAFENEKLTAILAGDLNFDTAEYSQEAGLENYHNILEGMVTCNNEGKIKLRGEKFATLEKIDGIIANKPIHFSNIQAVQVKSFDDILSDHYAVSATFATPTIQ